MLKGQSETYEDWEPNPYRKVWKSSLVIVDRVRGTKEAIVVMPSDACWLCPVCDSLNPEQRGGTPMGSNRLGFCLACYTARPGTPQVKR